MAIVIYSPMPADCAGTGADSPMILMDREESLFDRSGAPRFNLPEETSRRGEGNSTGLVSLPFSGVEYTGADLAARSAKKEALLSFLLPGLGQHRMGRTVRSKIYFSLEGIAWISAGAFYWQSVARRDAFEDYAVAYAGVSGTGHSESYYKIIANYMSNDGPGGYNEYILREARDMYYPDMAAIEDYYQDNILTGDMSWRWENEGVYRRYSSLYSGYDVSKKRIVYTLFFALGVRVVSMVDAFKIAGGGDYSSQEQSRQISIDIDPAPDGFRMTMTRSF